MRIIDEIRHQRALLGPAQAERDILSHCAFQQLLAEGDEVSFAPIQHPDHTSNRLHGMSISIAEESEREVAVLAGA